MCNSAYASSAIDQTNTGFVLTATTVAHEMGHNFGMLHDDESTNGCSSGYIMSPTASADIDVTWSSCSADDFNAFTSRSSPYDSPGYAGITCLSASAPSNTWEDGVCGDGLLSDTEDCDTGGVSDACCDAVRY